MATGDITKSALNTLVLATSGLSSVIQPVSGNVYAVAYVGPGSDGWIATFSCNPDGTDLALIDSFEFEADTCSQYHLDFKHVHGEFFAVVYRDGTGSYGGAGVLKNIRIGPTGLIYGIEYTWQFAAGCGFPKLLHRAGTVWIIFFDDTYVGQGRVGTTHLYDNGTISSAWIDSTLTVNKCRNAQIAHVGGDIYICAYNNALAQGKLSTIGITAAGQVDAAWIDTEQFDTSIEAIGNILELSSGYFVIPYDASTADLETFSVSSVGIIALIENQQFGADADYSWIINVPNSTMYITCFIETTADTLHTWNITNVGVITDTKQDIWAFSSPGDDPCIYHIGAGIYLITFTGTGGDFRAITLAIETPGAVYPADDMIRVTNLIHRYNRKQGVYELEMALGEVTSDFGLPQWLEAAMSAAPEDRTADIVQEVINKGLGTHVSRTERTYDRLKKNWWEFWK